MSENKRPYENDGMDETKVFNLNGSDNDYSSKRESLNDFSDNDEISSYSPADKSNYKDDFDMGTVSENEPKPIVSKTNTYGNKKGKNSNNNKKIIIICVAIIALVAIIVSVVFALNSCDSSEVENTNTSTTVEITTEDVYTTYSEDTSVYETESTFEETTEPITEETTVETTTLPEPTTASLSQNGTTVNASFAPYKCITSDGDLITDDFVSEFGGNVSVSLSSDGTYSLELGTVANGSGEYEINGNAITLGDIEGNISFDNDGNPIAVTIYLDDYTIAFN